MSTQQQEQGKGEVPPGAGTSGLVRLEDLQPTVDALVKQAMEAYSHPPLPPPPGDGGKQHHLVVTVR